MSHHTYEYHESMAKTFFDNINPEHRAEVEALYEAFKSRLIVELRVQGHANLGAVNAHLEERS